jgi:hypothetical protein
LGYNKEVIMGDMAAPARSDGKDGQSVPVASSLETSPMEGSAYSSSAAFLKAAKPPLAVDATVLQHAVGSRTSGLLRVLHSDLVALYAVLCVELDVLTTSRGRRCSGNPNSSSP